MLSLRSTTIPSVDDILRWSQDNPGYRFDVVNGETIVTPTGGKSGIRNSMVGRKLGTWADAHGYLAFGSSTLFVFGTLKLSPDEALLKSERFQTLSAEDQEKPVTLAPDVAVEIISKSHQFGVNRNEVRRKCEAMHEAGVEFVVMLDPFANDPSQRVTTWGAAPPDFPHEWDDVLNA